jgi:hypothetical protein
MPTIRDLFKQQKNDLYGKSENIRIESRGFINPPRVAALLTSSPSKIGDIIGNQLGGALGGSANRPSDTIFKGTAFFRKPITLPAVTQALLRDAVEPDRKYFVKEAPAPNSIIGKIKQGASSPVGVAATVAQQALNKVGSPTALKKLARDLKTKIGPAQGYGPGLGRTQLGGKPLGGDRKFSEYKEVIDLSLLKPLNPQVSILTDEMVKSLELRSAVEKAGWDGGNKLINETEKYDDLNKLQEDIKKYRPTNQVWVLFKKQGNKSTIPFVGSVTGLSEDIQPEWTNFRYVGSPFKVNRYQGVERSLKFNLKLYYTTVKEKNVMIKKVNYLKSLAFPYDEISQMTYGGNTQTSQYAFSPNLVYLTIGDMYKNIYGFIENLSFSVEDNTTWPSADPNGLQDGRPLLQRIFGVKNDNTLYPSIIDVSISLKIIENHQTETKGGITKYKYNFDGLSYEKDGQTESKTYKNVFGIEDNFNISETKEQ